MKDQRHQKILELIRTYPIERQEDLLKYLQDAGYKVTQATVSRDIRQLGLSKSSAGGGRYRYVQQDQTFKKSEVDTRFETIFGESAVSVESAGHIVMVQCRSGMASAACEVFDLIDWKNVIGSLAGENTFIVLTRSEQAASDLAAELRKHIKQG